MSKPLTVLCVNGESDPAETGSFIEMHKAGVEITVITWPNTFNYDALMKAGVPTIPYVLTGQNKPEMHSLHPCRTQKKVLQRPAHARQACNDEWIVCINRLERKTGCLSRHRRQRVLSRSIVLDYLLNPRLDRIICVCEAIRQSLLSLGMPGIRLRREVPVTIYKGHNPDWYSRATGGPETIRHSGRCICCCLYFQSRAAKRVSRTA